MTERLTNWMAAYVRAWSSNAGDDIRALFTADAVYRDRPNGTNDKHGLDSIVDGWLESADAPEDWSFEWSTVVETGDTAIVQAVTRYLTGPSYDNLWVLRFDGDRVSDFTEWYMQRA